MTVSTDQTVKGTVGSYCVNPPSKCFLAVESWDQDSNPGQDTDIFAILFPFIITLIVFYTNNIHATFWNEEKRAEMAILGSKSHVLAFLRFLDRTFHRTVMHRPDGPLIPKWRSDTDIYGVHRQTVFWRTVPSHRHCTALVMMLACNTNMVCCVRDMSWFMMLHKYGMLCARYVMVKGG
jgi:hypothetical protein